MGCRLVENERVRLRAAVLNMASASSFTAGVLAPTVAVFSGTLSRGVPLRMVLAGAGLCLFTSVALHSYAYRILEELQE